MPEELKPRFDNDNLDNPNNYINREQGRRSRRFRPAAIQSLGSSTEEPFFYSTSFPDAHYGRIFSTIDQRPGNW